MGQKEISTAIFEKHVEKVFHPLTGEDIYGGKVLGHVQLRDHLIN